ncbi:hypothetical protein FOXB_14753 [Fusarium oxysporum f. sp. conglutinans Fo5176]|uniref:Uncharacterized protein n=1 Tax=Fusarium oxysporum (strain Fo5176) TaxID=660025 RepID=F9G7X1_FUSOF|nr:hypothetical protein FOXB_14753 [Fusarium oxysporum f. sp. conglutinans Fo5176]
MSQDEIWIDGEDEGFEEEDYNARDPTHFTIALESKGQQGVISADFHVRNRDGERQRKAVSAFHGGCRKKPAFTVTCNAKAMIHGNMGSRSQKAASLLVYEFKFNSYNGTRIKEANISLQFRAAGGLAGGPSVKEVRPSGWHKMEPSTQNESSTRGIGVNLGPQVPGANIGVDFSDEDTIEKVTKHHTVVIGDNPQSDDWGNYYEARFNLHENESQKTGIPSKLNACILLERDNDDDFYCDPYIKVTPDFSTGIMSLFSSRSPDEEIWFRVTDPPFNELDGNVNINAGELGATPFEDIWDCTMYHKYDGAVKPSKA